MLADKFGADTARMFALFAAPPEKDVDWRDEGVEGIYRFLGRVYRFATRNIERARPAAAPESADRKVLRKLHQTIQKITEDFETRWHFNTSHRRRSWSWSTSSTPRRQNISGRRYAAKFSKS